MHRCSPTLLGLGHIDTKSFLIRYYDVQRGIMTFSHSHSVLPPSLFFIVLLIGRTALAGSSSASKCHSTLDCIITNYSIITQHSDTLSKADTAHISPLSYIFWCFCAVVHTQFSLCHHYPFCIHEHASAATS